MRIFTILSFAFLLFTLSACDDRKEILVLEEETNSIHDKAMADLAGMKRTKRSMRKEMMLLDSLNPSNPYRDSILFVFSLMENAEQDMNNWMINYKAPDKNTDKATALKYLTEQRDFMKKNSADIIFATQKGTKCLENLESKEK